MGAGLNGRGMESGPRTQMSAVSAPISAMVRRVIFFIWGAPLELTECVPLR